MKMHRILAQAAADIINAVFRDNKVLDRELAKAFEANSKWGKRDRSFIAETVFEVVRWRRALEFIIESDETNALCAAQWIRMGFDIPEWWSYHGADSETAKIREADLPKQARAIRESIPDWLDELGAKELGEAWASELAGLNKRSRVYLRVNRLRSNRDEAIEWLSGYHIEVDKIPELPDALALKPGKTLAKSLKADGRVEIQDTGSQQIAPLLAPQPGDYVIDACAGAGGKTLHLAALMGNQGRIVAMDIASRKLIELERRAKRARATKCIQTCPITPTTLSDYAEYADRLLIDAPCSGLGTLKRQPDLKWRLRPKHIEQIKQTQAELLHTYTAMLKPGGRLVYATCSILPSENRAAIEPLLAKGTFRFIEEKVISPQKENDGFYAAALLKQPT